MESLFIICGLVAVGSTIAVYLRKLYVEAEREERKAKYEIEKHFDRLEQNEREVFAFKRRHLQQENERIAERAALLENKVKKYAEAAMSIGRVGYSAFPKKQDSEGYGSQDKTAFFDMLDRIIQEPIKSKKFQKEKTVNKNILDPTTGDRLPIVQCFCGTIYEESSYNAYGCDCETKTINKK